MAQQDVVTLTEAKAQLRVMNNAEDTIIQLYIDAAVDYVENFINQTIPGRADPNGEIPAAIKAATLMIIAGLYLNRESESEAEIKKNPAVENLLYPYRVDIGI